MDNLGDAGVVGDEVVVGVHHGQQVHQLGLVFGQILPGMQMEDIGSKICKRIIQYKKL